MANVVWPPNAGGTPVLPETLLLADATTNTAPDGIIERHTTSGTAAAGFGLTNATELQSAGGNVPRVITEIDTLVTATDAAETAQRHIQIMSGGTLREWGTMLMATAAVQALYFGSTASTTGIQVDTVPSIALLAGGVAKFRVGAAVTLAVTRFSTARGAGIAAATTITLGSDGNVFPVSIGTGTINSIVATGWQAGSRIVLELASGITLTNSVAGTGATVLTNTGASIVTAFTRMIPLTYNGTNWIVEG